MTPTELSLPALEAVRAHLTAASGLPVSDLRARPLGGGACQDNHRVDLTLGGRPAVLVLRSDPPDALPGSLSRAQEHAVIEAACAEGVPTPRSRWLTQGLLREGAWALFLDWAPGVAIGARVVRDPELEGARQHLPQQLGAALAAIHRVRPPTPLPLAPVEDPVEAALAALRQTLDALPQPRPAQELAFRWLTHHRPAPGPVVLVHGDYRVGNLLVTPEGLSAVVDWEFAHWGSGVEDLAWLCVRDWRFGRLDRPAGGLCARAALWRAYEAAGGAPVDPAAAHFWEVYGNLRWAAGAILQGTRAAAGPRDIELLAIPWRAAEMEYEALRLIHQGPQEVR